jgi:lysophospholipase L1-like esterase
MSARGRFLSVLVTIVVALAGFVTVGALPAAAAPPAVQYVALGDSYAAGTAVGSFPFCPHGDGGYPRRLHDLGSRIDLQDNLACSGATTGAVTVNQLPVLKDLNGDTRLVTLTVGASNLGLSVVLAACFPTPTPACEDAIDNVRDNLLPRLGNELTVLYPQVAVAAPRARIVVTGYPHLFQPESFPPDQAIVAEQINLAIDALNSTIEGAVSIANDADVNIHYVDVVAEFAGHGIGGTVPPAFIFPPGGPVPTEAFHPTPAGYDAYADAIAAALPGGWFKQSV